MTNIVYKRLPSRYGVIPNEDESAVYGTYDIIVPAHFINNKTGDLLPFVSAVWQPVLDRMKDERDNIVRSYIDEIAANETDETQREQLKQIHNADIKKQVEYIRSKHKDKYEDLLARFKAVDKTKTLIIPADVSAWSRRVFDSRAPDDDNELTKWAEQRIKDSWPTGVMRQSPTVQWLGRQGIRYPAGANLGDFVARAGIDILSIPIDTPLGIISLYNSLRTNPKDTIARLPAAVLDTLYEKYGGFDKIVTSLSESPINTVADILGAIALTKSVVKTAARGAATMSPRARQLIPLAEEATAKHKTVTPGVLKEINKQKYDAIRQDEIRMMNDLSQMQTKLDALSELVHESQRVGSDTRMLGKELDDLAKTLDATRRKIDAKHKHLNIPIEQKITGSKIDELMQRANEVAAASAADYHMMSAMIDDTMRRRGVTPMLVKGAALRPQYEMLLLSAPGTAPKAVRKGMADRIDTIIEELLDVQDKQRRTKSKSELKQLENRLNELESQLQRELGGYLQP